MHFLHALGFDYQSRVPQIIQHSLDDWAKPGKRPMTITITNTVPPITKVTEIKDFTMIYLWSLTSDLVAGSAVELSKRTDVIISEQKKDIELTLPTAIIDIFMERQEGSFTTNDDVPWSAGHLHHRHERVYASKDGKKPAHVKTDHVLHAVRQRGYSESPPVNVMLNAIGRALAPLGIKALMMEPLHSKDTLIPTAMGKYHVGFDLTDHKDPAHNSQQRTHHERVRQGRLANEPPLARGEF